MFETIQTRAYNELVKFKNKEKRIDQSGIEEHLVQPYLDQIIDINKHVITDWSTNYPNNNFFQEMCIGGIIEKHYAEKFMELLNTLDVSYVVDNRRKINKDLAYLLVIQDMHSKPFFNTKKLYDNYGKFAYLIQNNIKYIQLAKKVRMKNIRKLCMLNADELNIIKEIIDMPEHENRYDYDYDIDPDIDPNIDENDIWTHLMFGNDFFEPGEFEYIKSETVRFDIFANDPFERTLYVKLLSIFDKMYE